VPIGALEITRESSIQSGRRVKKFAFHVLFFTHLGLVILRLHTRDNLFDFFPDFWVVNKKPFMAVEVRIELNDFQFVNLALASNVSLAARNSSGIWAMRSAALGT
jgi:hypothetical protein